MAAALPSWFEEGWPPLWADGVVPDGVVPDGVVDQKNLILAYPPPRLAMPRHPSYPGRKPFAEHVEKGYKDMNLHPISLSFFY